MAKSRINLLDAALLVIGAFVVLLIASSALGVSWTVRLGHWVIVWPNRLRHSLFVALGVVVVGRVLLWRHHRIASAVSGLESRFAPSSFRNRWLLGGIVGLITATISLRAFGVQPFRNILHHNMAHWVLEQPLERLPLILVPGYEWGSIRAGYFRPITVYTYLVDLIWGAAPAGVLLFSILLYSILSVQVGLLAWRLVQDARVAWASALLFALFPLRSEVVLEIAHRDEILYSLFYLRALIEFMDFEQAQDRRKLVRSMGVFLLAILSKEQGFSFPILLGFYVAMSSVESWWLRIKKVFVVITPYVAIAILVILYRVTVQGEIGTGQHGALWLDRRLLTLGSLVFYGLLYPLPLSVMPTSTLRFLEVALLSIPILFLLWTRSFDWRLWFLMGALPISASVSSTIIELYETGWTVWYFTLPSAFFSIAVAFSVILLPAERVRRIVTLPLLALYVTVYATTFYLLQGAFLEAHATR